MRGGNNLTGYISDMRKLVGHKTIMQCAASIICVDGQNRILLGRRSDNHKWGYSGGSVEIDEYVEDMHRILQQSKGVADLIIKNCIESQQ